MTLTIMKLVRAHQLITILSLIYGCRIYKTISHKIYFKSVEYLLIIIKY